MFKDEGRIILNIYLELCETKQLLSFENFEYFKNLIFSKRYMYFLNMHICSIYLFQSNISMTTEQHIESLESLLEIFLFFSFYTIESKYYSGLNDRSCVSLHMV